MAIKMPSIFILYSGAQGRTADKLAEALSKYAFAVQQGTELDDATDHAAIIAISTPNAWAAAKFKEAARLGFAANNLMLVRFTKFGISKPHPYSQIIENSLVNWKGDEDTDWQAMLKRIGRLAKRPGLEALARIRSGEVGGKKHIQLQEWANQYKNDPAAEQVKAQISVSSFVPSQKQQKSIAKVLLAVTLISSIFGFGWQSYRVHQLNYNASAKQAWDRVDTREIIQMRRFVKAFHGSDQARLAAFLLKEREAEFWEQTRRLDSIEAYDTFLERYTADLVPRPEFIAYAETAREALLESRRESYAKLQIALSAVGYWADIKPLAHPTRELIQAISAYSVEDPSLATIADWELVTLPEIEALAGHIKLFGRRQMLAYKSKRWAGLNAEYLQELPTGFSNFKRQGGFNGTSSVTLYFEENSYILTPESLILLWELAGVRNFVDIIITGHDDGNRPRLASFRLAELRAANVKNALVGFGVRERLISMRAWGATRPVVDIVPDVPAPLNRRVELTLLSR